MDGCSVKPLYTIIQCGRKSMADLCKEGVWSWTVDGDSSCWPVWTEEWRRKVRGAPADPCSCCLECRWERTYPAPPTSKHPGCDNDNTVMIARRCCCVLLWLPSCALQPPLCKHTHSGGFDHEPLHTATQRSPSFADGLKKKVPQLRSLPSDNGKSLAPPVTWVECPLSHC